MTPTLGWQTVSNPAAAALGQAVETDAQLRARQKQSVALPSRSVFEGILASVAAIDGVSAISGIDNDTSKTDSNGIPPHSIAIIADGGDTQAIADAFPGKKGREPGRMAIPASRYSTATMLSTTSVFHVRSGKPLTFVSRSFH